MLYAPYRTNRTSAFGPIATAPITRVWSVHAARRVAQLRKDARKEEAALLRTLQLFFKGGLS
jgi:hypothetical protein